MREIVDMNCYLSNILRKSDVKAHIQSVCKSPLQTLSAYSGDHDYYVLHRNSCLTFRFPATIKIPPHHMLDSHTSAAYCMLLFVLVHLLRQGCFLWGYRKNFICETPVESEEDMLARVMVGTQYKNLQ